MGAQGGMRGELLATAFEEWEGVPLLLIPRNAMEHMQRSRSLCCALTCFLDRHVVQGLNGGGGGERREARVITALDQRA